MAAMRRVDGMKIGMGQRNPAEGPVWGFARENGNRNEIMVVRRHKADKLTIRTKKNMDCQGLIIGNGSLSKVLVTLSQATG